MKVAHPDVEGMVELINNMNTATEGELIKSIDAFAQIIFSYIDSSVSRTAYYPASLYCREFHSGFLQLKEQARNNLPRYNTLFKMLVKKVHELHERNVIFEGMAKCLDTHITLDVVQDALFGEQKVYLKQGVLIFPNSDNGPSKHHVAEFFFPQNNTHMEINLLPDKFPDEKRAVSEYAGKIVGTVAIGRNTENYPILETSIPVLSMKYAKSMELLVPIIISDS